MESISLEILEKYEHYKTDADETSAYDIYDIYNLFVISCDKNMEQLSNKLYPHLSSNEKLKLTERYSSILTISLLYSFSIFIYHFMIKQIHMYIYKNK